MLPRFALGAFVSACVLACGLDLRGASDLTIPTDDGGPTALDADIDTNAPAPIDGGNDETSVKGPPFPPSHVGGAAFDPNAGDLADVTLIVTSATPQVSLTGGGALPSGTRIEVIDGKAVLFVRKWRVNVPLRVRGDRPLIVLASDDVEVLALLDAGGIALEAGPGGAASAAGPGKGSIGGETGDDDGGGGGAGFGTVGANGGNTKYTVGGTGGPAYGGTFDQFLGGSGGGIGADQPSYCTGHAGRGGAGGGAIQVSALGRIRITSGGINVGGAGGGGGCAGSTGITHGTGGGGGGSGGSLVLESRDIRVEAILSSNGGGGGGGSIHGTTPGANGADAKSAAIAAGGPTPTGSEGGAGGARGAPPVKPGGAPENSGGGGGAVGRIWLRSATKGIDIRANAAISPDPVTVLDL